MKIIKIALSILLITTANMLSAQNLDNVNSEKPVSISGNLSVGGFSYFSNGIAPRQSPFGYSLSGRLNVNIYGVDLPFYASINDQKTSFSQPFKRFGVSPKYKWIQLHAGWRTLNYSQFTLNNMNFLGGGIDLTPGKFRFSAMRGILKQSTLLGDINFGDPQFERKATAVKIGVGDEMNFIDFIGFQAADDLSSLQLSDSLSSVVPAQENLVLGVRNHLTLIKNRLLFDMDASVSAFSYDIRSDSIPIPFLENSSWMNSLFTPRLSSSANYAGESSLTYRIKMFSIAAKYRRVTPEFNSLGSEYILNDVEALTINPAFQLWKGKIMLSASAGRQRNNLDGMRANTNNRTIASVNLSVQPSAKYGVNMTYSNYSFQQQVVIDSIYSDSLVVNQLNHNFMLMPRYTHLGENYIHTVFLTLNYQILDDQNTAASQSASNTMQLANLIYSLRHKKTGLSINGGFNYFNFNSGMVNVNRIGANLGGGIQALNNKLNLRANVSYNIQTQNDIQNQFIILNFNTSYRVFKKTSISFSGNVNNSKSVALSYMESRFQISITQGF